MSKENKWIKNIGIPPKGLVDLKTNGDDGFGDIIYWTQDPKEWNWTTSINGIVITCYRQSENIGIGK